MTAGCEHTRTDATARGTYCLDCGMRLVGEPGPISILHPPQNRVWRDLADKRLPLMISLSKTYIGARYNHATRVWMLGRVIWCEECDHWEVAQDLNIDARCHSAAHITHVALDSLGTPHLPAGGR